MPLKSYAVLKGKVKAKVAHVQTHPHYHLWITANGLDYRAAINIRSMHEPAAMQYLLKFRFRHPITADLSRLTSGLHPVEPHSGGLALDYIRLNLFHRDQFLTLPFMGPDCGGDLSDVMDGVVGGAMVDPACRVYVFGEPWEADASDRVFRFYPSRGLHEVHMNQGNDPSHWSQDGPWQDGAILFEHPRQERWTALFLKFQTQSWQTDDATGHPLPPSREEAGVPPPQQSEGAVRIIAVLVRPLNGAGRPKGGPESVTLLNVCPFPVNLEGWTLHNRAHSKWKLHGTLAPGEAREVPLGESLALGNRGGIVTLANREGYKVHGVSYTAEQAARDGWRIPF